MNVVVPVSVLLPIFFAILRYRSLTPAAKAILLYLCFSALLYCVTLYIGRVLHKNNLPVFHIGTLLEFLLLAEVYKKLLPYKKAIIAIQLFFIAACIVNSLFFQSIYIFNSYTRSLEAILLMLLAINYFAKLFTELSSVRLIELPSFWYNTGIFLYFSGAFMLFIFSNYIVVGSFKNYSIIFGIHAALILLMYLLFTLGFLKCKK